MRAFGNLMNRIAEESKMPEPIVGMGATIVMYSDRHACTIVDTFVSGKTVIVQQDKAIRTDSNGMSECQSYHYESDTSAPRREFSKRKNGRWVEVGSKVHNGTTLDRRARQLPRLLVLACVNRPLDTRPH